MYINCNGSLSMFLFIRKIIALINMYHCLPNTYLELKHMRNLMKRIMDNEFLPSLYSILFNYQKLPKSEILFITHELSRTGAPKVALETLKAIKSIYGIKPTVVAIRGGEMQQDFINEGFEVHFINELPIAKEEFKKFCNQFKLVFVSSVALEFLYCIEFIDTPVVWYSHEIFKSKKDIELIEKFVKLCSKILCGSPLTQKSINDAYKDLNTKLLIYGLKEEKYPETKKDTDKFTFICPASIEERKNQKVLVEAIKLLPDEIRDKIMVYIIGSSIFSNKKYYEQFLKMAEEVKEIQLLPNIPMQELLEYYGKADCLVCPSIKDPMPIVVSYAFMFKKLVLASETIGQSLLAKNGENAVLFDPNNAEQLRDCIVDIVTNKEKYSAIAQNGRKIYEEYFSIEMFNKNLKESLDEYLL